MNFYISGIGAVNAGLPYENENYDGSPGSVYQAISCTEPDYKLFIDPKFSRRLSRIIKMSLYAASMAVSEAGISVPDGIITGTSLGCLADTEKFLKSMIEDNEMLVSPSAFIQSTHNSISSQIAIAFGCNGYNSTFSSRGLSFESALTDAMLQLGENPEAGLLVGSSDELTEELLKILSNREFGRHSGYNSDNDLRQIFPFGEGTAYFYATGEKKPGSFCRVTSVKTFFYPDGVIKPADIFIDAANKHGDELSGVDLVMFGGSDNEDALTISERLSGAGVVMYKKYSGEYLTSASYAMWLSCMILRNGLDKRIIICGESPHPEKILIFNSCGNKYGSFVIVENV